MSAPRVVANHYLLEHSLGEGGMGTVYLARDLHLDRYVAVKIIKQGYLTDPKTAQRLSKEATTLASLSHPNIVKILAAHFDDIDSASIVLELVDGQTLSNLVKETGPLSPSRATALMLQALDALSHAHSQGIVHRDLKPQNLMIDQNGDLKILDFGIAKLIGVDDQRLTKTGEILGSPNYISPEQCTTGIVSQSTDIYSLGCCLYFMLTGRPPFEGNSSMEVLLKQINETADLSFIQDGKLCSIAEKCLRKEPGQRFQTARELLNAIADDTELKGISVTRKVRKSDTKRSHMPLYLVASTVIMAALAVALFVLKPFPKEVDQQREPYMRRLGRIKDHVKNHKATAQDAVEFENLRSLAFEGGSPFRICEWQDVAELLYAEIRQPKKRIMHLEEGLKFRLKADDLYKYSAVRLYTSLLGQNKQATKAVPIVESYRRLLDERGRHAAARGLLYELVGIYSNAHDEQNLSEVFRRLDSVNAQQLDALVLQEAENLETAGHNNGWVLCSYYLLCPHTMRQPALRAKAYSISCESGLRGRDFKNARSWAQQAVIALETGAKDKDVSAAQRKQCKDALRTAKELLASVPRS